MYGYTFRDCAEGRFPGSINSPATSRIIRELRRADRSYCRDNLHPQNCGNYLEEFLRAHGDEEAVPVRAELGSPHAAGAGVVILDLGTERRRLEDALRKNPQGLCELLAVWDGEWRHR